MPKDRPLTPTAHIATDLLTPLGAHLRLRAAAPASSLLESVEQGRPGRHSFIGSAIRTVVLAGGLVRLQAGARIVADSDPAAEHRECLAKLAALEAALDLAERER